VDILRRLLRIVGPLPLVLGSALSDRGLKSRDLLAEFAIDSAIFLFSSQRSPWPPRNKVPVLIR